MRTEQRVDERKLGVLRVESGRKGKRLNWSTIGEAMPGGAWSRARVHFHGTKVKHGLPISPDFIAALLNAISVILGREVGIAELVMDEDLPTATAKGSTEQGDSSA